MRFGATRTAGLAATEEGLLVLTGYATSVLSSFDLETGRFIDSFALLDTPGTSPPVGLFCGQ